MQCAVYDTYVTRKAGRTMNFNVIVGKSTPRSKAIKYGKYLNSVDQGEQRISQEECQFCHIQEAHNQVKKIIWEKDTTSQNARLSLTPFGNSCEIRKI